MKLLSWNVNHRTRPKPIPDLIPEAIQALAPDLLVLTEYVRGSSHDVFLARLANFGLRHALISPEIRGENSVLIVGRRSLALGSISAPALAPSMPYNFLHVELPEDRLQLMGIRIPDYSRQAQMRKACWDWFCSVAAEVVSDPTVIIGDFNSDPNYSKARCGDRFEKLVEDGWQLALPEEGASYWSPNNHAVRLDHAFVSKHSLVLSSRYITHIAGLTLANRCGSMLPDHAALEVVIENGMDYIVGGCRRLLEMVQILHRQGYERLRINPGMSPSGCHWRCEFLPSEVTIAHDRNRHIRRSVETARYSSGERRNYFGWIDAAADLPFDLSVKFIERFPDLAKASTGRDPEYAKWYSMMLAMTAPDGIIYSYADYPLPDDHLPVQNRPDLRIPFPPGASDTYRHGDGAV